VAGALHAAGVGRGDRVAIVLPNGPEMAAAFVSVAQVATTCPLNPAYKQDEFAFYLEDLKAKAIILMEGEDGPGLRGGRGAGSERDPAGARCGGAGGGLFAARRTHRREADTAAPGPGDVALILHTSGHDVAAQDRAAPAIEPRGLGAEHRDLAEPDGADRCLNVMPLFHIHGLIAAVSASLAAGGSVWCAPGFDALKFFAG
jgi:acyl-CoA synthetase (AMP-forming)/AMP-acid ligase II